MRIEFPGAIYHLTARGNAKCNIFYEDDDKKSFLAILADVVKRYDWICHSYCLMSNHYHLLIETQKANLSHGMRQLNGVYSMRFNKAHSRVGHLFQGRYKGIIIDRENYLLELCRYIEEKADIAEIQRAQRFVLQKPTVGFATFDTTPQERT